MLKQYLECMRYNSVIALMVTISNHYCAASYIIISQHVNEVLAVELKRYLLVYNNKLAL